MTPDPEKSIKTSRSGRRAAAVRDGRHTAGNAKTQPLQVAQHTPGPWKVSCLRANGDLIRDGRLYHRVASQYGDTIAEYAYVEAAHRPVAEANARLISAAPEMLAALKAQAALIADMSRFVAQMALEDYALFNEAPMMASAAIAKATGAKP